ncbi:CoA pyrophosphatase [Lysinibacillus sphaericus]|uniref:Coenzyme A pyrophosphatase n=2 Tax=Lysinibacillus TaxID=400634 RepID=A0A2S0K1N7_LYSSH|nr:MULTISPECIES: CoA pyrophosphatase [Lysinibacillus]AVK97228.1 coenzyme A pyrophosphatase [Lysinibacillus sphaericus]MCS1382149.1 CoA pyrophosphatase [Lysinibacillus sphaericus]MED4542523.1 CoA pyrophosphatase [Lysinibacillus sphaericus]TKI20085.1 CoA pyrophosphatase [Lysinibacillus sphaericus]TKI47599.1 CoA pyrophosphatase [Lysinibacillus tabacifolii]
MFLDKLKHQLQQNQSLFIGEETAFRSAVLIPLVQVDDKWHILFEVRSLTMRKQPGDISFPGGRIDATDASPLAAALRETHEELGIDPTTVHVVGPLSPYITSSSFVTYPFVAIIDTNQIIHEYNKDEVEEVLTVPIDWLLNYEPYMHLVSVEPMPSIDFPFDKIVNGAQYKWRTRSMEEWFFDYEQYTIWGLTARILKHFIELIK